MVAFGFARNNDRIRIRARVTQLIVVRRVLSFPLVKMQTSNVTRVELRRTSQSRGLA